MNKQTPILILMLGVLIACKPDFEDQKELPKLLSDEELIKRGKLLMTTSGCHDCHSPKVMTDLGSMPDTSRLLSGHPSSEKNPVMPVNKEGWILFSMGLTSAVGPWGISYAANLTPDDTGIGNWTFEQFKTALRKGKYKGLEGSRPLLPPMPWPMYRNFSDQDMEAMFKYLKSIKPIKNQVPAPIGPDELAAIKN